MSKIIWSKGLLNKDQYCLAHTGYLSSREELYYQLHKESDIMWIRNNRYDLYLLNDILDKPITLYISDGDWCFPDDYNEQEINKLVDNPFIIKIFAQNYNSKKNLKKCFNYPIGFDLHTKEWFIGNYNYEKIKFMISKRDFKDKYFCVFCDCHLTPERHPDRKELSLLNNKLITKLGSRIPCKEILLNYSKYRFVLSAHGNGLDCHRTYEALLCGAIVIMKHSCLDPLFEDLPVVLINNYSEITPENLIEWYKQKINKCNIQNILKKLSYNFYK